MRNNEVLITANNFLTKLSSKHMLVRLDKGRVRIAVHNNESKPIKINHAKGVDTLHFGLHNDFQKVTHINCDDKNTTFYCICTSDLDMSYK